MAVFFAYNEDEVARYAHLHDYVALLDELEEQLRRWLKYENPFKNADEALEETRRLVLEGRAERNISRP